MFQKVIFRYYLFLDNCKDETTSTWLIAVMQFGLKIDLFKPLKAFKLKMKEVKYSLYQKLITTMMSIVIGCETTKEINLCKYK